MLPSSVCWEESHPDQLDFFHNKKEPQLNSTFRWLVLQVPGLSRSGFLRRASLRTPVPSVARAAHSLLVEL